MPADLERLHKELLEFERIDRAGGGKQQQCIGLKALSARPAGASR